jgi:hypothetical protein
VRYLIELMGACLFSGTKLGRALASDVPEYAPEGAEAVPSGLQRNLDNGHFSVPKQSFGALDTTRQQIAVRRYTERFLERPGEVRSGNSTDSGQSLDWPVLFRRRIHAVFRAQQPAQQGWIPISQASGFQNFVSVRICAQRTLSEREPHFCCWPSADLNVRVNHCVTPTYDALSVLRSR